MADMIITSECEECIHSIINEEDKARVKIYCKVKDKTYYWGQCIPCEHKEKRKEWNIIENLHKTKYTKRNVTKEWLYKNGFRYNKIFSDEENEVYTYRFSVYKYGDINVLECELVIVLQTGGVSINVYDKNTRNKYAPFYNVEYGNYDKILNVINNRIEKELERLDIRKDTNNGSKDKETKGKRNNSNKGK